MLQSHCLFTDYFLGRFFLGTVQYRSRNRKKIAVYFCELRGKNLKNVSKGCLAMGEGTAEKIFRVPGRNRTHDLRKAGRMP